MGKAKIVRATPAAQPPPPTPHWHSVPPDLLRAVRADGFLVEQGDDGEYAVRATPSHPHNLMRLRVRKDGTLEGRASGNSPIGKTKAFRLAAQRAVARIDAALLQTSLERENVHVLKALRWSHASLLSAEKKYAPSSRRHRLRIKVVQGGLPGLGKRR